MNIFKQDFTLAKKLPKMRVRREKLFQQIKRLDNRIELAEFEKEKKDWSAKQDWSTNRIENELDKIWND